MNKSSEAVKQFAKMKVTQIATSLIGKQIPNLYKIEDQLGFGIRISEGELNFGLYVTAVPVEEAGPGNFLFTLGAMFYQPAVVRQGYQFEPVPLGRMVEMQYPLYAEDEQELTDGIMQILIDESENIICQLLE